MDRYSTFCTFHLSDCFGTSNENSQKRFSALPSIKRETNVLDQQPHLVAPMTLRVYEELPSTPLISEPSQLTQWGRNLASRASSRTSRMSTKKVTTLKSFISKPQPVQQSTDELPLRRRRDFSPLQLSFYGDVNRLSDLPEFDRLSFTEGGELKAPPKALIRTQSESMLRSPRKLVVDIPKRTASMFEVGEVTYARPETSHSIISTSRPPSEYDALHSHPVSWASLPGIPVSKSQKIENIVAVLTPMQEEFSPATTAVSVDGTLLSFPKAADLKQQSVELISTPEAQAPYPVISQGPSGTVPRARSSSIHPYFHTNYQTQKRISQWLHYRGNSNSTSSIASVSTTASFAEHRRKRSEFYKLSQQAQVAQEPKPLKFKKTVSSRQHQRTNTESTANTTDTSVLSTAFDADSKRDSQETLTTYTVADVRSRTNTIKSLASPAGLRIITTEDQGVSVPCGLSGEIVGHEGLYLDEINGPLRSPGVGVAF